MTLDEAIQHCEEVAETNERICATEPSIGLPDIYMHKDEAKKCAEEHRQLADWLKELKAYKEQDSAAISKLAIDRILNHEAKWINERFRKDEHGYEWVCSNCGTLNRSLYKCCSNCGTKEVE